MKFGRKTSPAFRDKAPMTSTSVGGKLLEKKNLLLSYLKNIAKFSKCEKSFLTAPEQCHDTRTYGNHKLLKMLKKYKDNFLN